MAFLLSRVFGKAPSSNPRPTPVLNLDPANKSKLASTFTATDSRPDNKFQLVAEDPNQTYLTVKSLNGDFQKLSKAWDDRVQNRISGMETWSMIEAAIDRFRALRQAGFKGALSATMSAKDNAQAVGAVLTENQLHDEYKRMIATMFQQAKQWALSCGGEIALPRELIPIRGFTKATNWARDLMIGSSYHGLQPPVRLLMLYGPPASGKTLLVHQIAQSMQVAKQMQIGSELGQQPTVTKTTANDSKTLKDAKDDAIPTSDVQFMTTYHLDAVNWGLKTNDEILREIDNAMRCMSVEMEFKEVVGSLAAYKARMEKTGTRPGGLLLLENMDVPWADQSQEERRTRAAQPLNNFGYYSGSKIRVAGANVAARPLTDPLASSSSLTSNTVPGSRTAGGRKTPVDPSEMDRGLAFQQQLVDRFGDDLQTRFPDIRVIWTARKPWKLPPLLRALIPTEHARFLDLPTWELRCYLAQQFTQERTIKNLFDWYRELKNRGDDSKLSAALDTEQTALGEDKDAHLKQDYALIRAIVNNLGDIKSLSDFTLALTTNQTGVFRDVNQWPDTEMGEPMDVNGNPAKDEKGNLIGRADVVLQKFTNIQTAWKEYTENREMWISSFADMTGFSLKGYCAMRDHLSTGDVRLFLNMMGKASDAMRIRGMSVFGFNAEEVLKALEKLFRENAPKMLQKGLDVMQGYVSGLTSAYFTGCYNAVMNPDLALSHSQNCLVELDQGLRVKRRFDNPVAPFTSSGKDASWVKKYPGSAGTPAAAPADNKIRPESFPLAYKYGSHRISSTDANAWISKLANSDGDQNTDPSLLLKKNDYVEFAAYVLRGDPKSVQPNAQKQACASVDEFVKSLDIDEKATPAFEYFTWKYGPRPSQPDVPKNVSSRRHNGAKSGAGTGARKHRSHRR